MVTYMKMYGYKNDNVSNACQYNLRIDFHQNLMDIEAYQRSETAAYLYTQGELSAVQRR